MNAMTEVRSDRLTRALAEQARTLSFADIPAEARTWARQCVLDYTACGVAGASDELTGILFAELSEQGGRDSATIFGQVERLPAASAALINGAASHALDFDDVTNTLTSYSTLCGVTNVLMMEVCSDPVRATL